MKTSYGTFPTLIYLYLLTFHLFLRRSFFIKELIINKFQFICAEYLMFLLKIHKSNVPHSCCIAMATLIAQTPPKSLSCIFFLPFIFDYE